MEFINMDYGAVVQKYESAKEILSKGIEHLTPRDRSRRKNLIGLLDEIQKATPPIVPFHNGKVRVLATTWGIADKARIPRKTLIADYLLSIRNLTGLVYEFEDYTMNFHR